VVNYLIKNVLFFIPKYIATVHARFDLFDPVMEKMQKEFSSFQMHTECVQLQRDVNQRKGRRALFAFVSTPKTDTHPSALPVGTATSLEKVTLRCKDAGCRHRPVNQQPTMATPASALEEIDMQDQDVDLLKQMLEADAQDNNDDTGGGDDGVAEDIVDAQTGGNYDTGKLYCVDLWPFALGYKLHGPCFEILLNSQRLAAIVIVTSSAQASTWYAARKQCPHVLVVQERTTVHARNHSIDVGLTLFVRDALVSAGQTQRKRILTTNHFDDMIIKGPTLDHSSQTVDGYVLFVS
jgi:hypothetical protein